jgi:UDP-N-acetylglucosamine--dolichyl-phosphate N-acetylglucosaminephosphotransferase
MLDAYSATALAMLGISFLVTYATIPATSSWMRQRGIVGIDVHKLQKPKIPEMCGLTIIAGLTVASLLSIMAVGEHSRETAAFL